MKMLLSVEDLDDKVAAVLAVDGLQVTGPIKWGWDSESGSPTATVDVRLQPQEERELARKGDEDAVLRAISMSVEAVREHLDQVHEDLRLRIAAVVPPPRVVPYVVTTTSPPPENGGAGSTVTVVDQKPVAKQKLSKEEQRKLNERLARDEKIRKTKETIERESDEYRHPLSNNLTKPRPLGGNESLTPPEDM